MMEADQSRELAIESLVEERRFGILLGGYVVFGLVMIAVWGLTGAGYFWPVWPIAAGLLAFAAVGLAGGWSNRSFAETTIEQRIAQISGRAPRGVQR